MTAGEARDRAGVIRGRLREAVRALSVPGTDWERARESLDWVATLAMELARDCMREDEERRQDVTVTIPTVRAFTNVEPDKAHVMKVAEESLEVFSAWENFRDDASDVRRSAVVDECADVIQATCNLLAALDVTDMTEAMRRCERRNRERGAMATDDERRRYVSWLRERAADGTSWPGIDNLAKAIGVEVYPRRGIEGRLLSRLADLIETGGDGDGDR